jgi:arginyl-tRNA synthetase
MTTLEVDGLVNLLGNLSVSKVSADIPELSILSNPLDVWRSALATILAGLLDSEATETYKSIQWPNNIFNGDLSVTLPKLRPGCKAAELSFEIMDKVRSSLGLRYAQGHCYISANNVLKFPMDNGLFDLPLLDSVHLRVFLKLDLVPRLLVPYILDRKDAYGLGPITGDLSNDPKKLVLEFSSPNINSEFQGKHLRSTIVGAFVGRLYESMGWSITRVNYLGDWGKQIALLYVGWTKFGSQEAYDTDPVGHLLDVYHQIEALFQPEQAASKQARDEAAKEGKDEGEAQADIESKGIFAERNEAFKKLEEGDKEVKSFWERVRGVMVKDYTSFYERLGIRFDEYSGESQVSAETMIEVEQMLKEKNITEESAGAWMVDMTKLGARAGHAIVRDRSGSSTYLLRDLAAVLERARKHSFDKMIYVVATDNSVHFSQMFKILEVLDKDLATKVQHVKFSEVSKVAASLGKGYKPQNILDKCEEAMATLSEADADKAALLGNTEQTSKTLATSALLIQELSTRLTTIHAFDTGSMAAFKLGSGVDFQYWHIKTSTLLSGHTASATLSDEDFSALEDEDQANLLRMLAQYPEVVKATFQSLEPSGVVTYLASVTEQLSDCLDEEEGEISVTPGLVALLEVTRIVLSNGMRLLGLTPVSELPQQRADTPIAE